MDEDLLPIGLNNTASNCPECVAMTLENLCSDGEVQPFVVYYMYKEFVHVVY